MDCPCVGVSATQPSGLTCPAWALTEAKWPIAARLPALLLRPSARRRSPGEARTRQPPTRFGRERPMTMRRNGQVGRLSFLGFVCLVVSRVGSGGAVGRSEMFGSEVVDGDDAPNAQRAINRPDVNCPRRGGAVDSAGH
jgi:hypothetical protein